MQMKQNCRFYMNLDEERRHRVTCGCIAQEHMLNIRLFCMSTSRGVEANIHWNFFLQGFTGYLQTDGYGGYDALKDVTHVGCMAHLKRKFHDAVTALPNGKKAGSAVEGEAYCERLFQLERTFSSLRPEERKQKRQELSKPVLEEFLAWGATRTAAKNSKLGIALTYLHNNSKELSEYLNDGRLEIFKAKRGGDGVAPEIRCEELSDNCDKRTWGLFFAGGSDVPDIMSGESSSAPMMYYEQSSNTYHYVFVSSKEDDWDDWDFTDTKVALTLHGDLTVEELAFMKVKMADPDSDMATRKFFLPAWRSVEAESGETGTPEEIDLQRYADIELARFGVESGQEAPISWHRAEEIQELIGLAKLPLVLENSYKVFLDGGNYY